MEFFDNIFETKIVICLNIIGQGENLLWKPSVFVKLGFSGVWSSIFASLNIMRWGWKLMYFLWKML